MDKSTSDMGSHLLPNCSLDQKQHHSLNYTISTHVNSSIHHSASLDTNNLAVVDFYRETHPSAHLSRKETTDFDR